MQDSNLGSWVYFPQLLYHSHLHRFYTVCLTLFIRMIFVNWIQIFLYDKTIIFDLLKSIMKKTIIYNHFICEKFILINSSFFNEGGLKSL